MQALEMFQATRQQDMTPHVVSYTTLISACQKGKQPEQALELFKAMRQQVVMSNVITYNTLIGASDKGSLSKPWKYSRQCSIKV